MRRFTLILILLMMTILSRAQADRDLINDGNRKYHKQDFPSAEILYRKALEKNPENSQAVYNLGCALMMQGKDSAAVEQYEKAVKIEKNKRRLSMAYHNIGVICQNKKLYSEAIEAYKQSLRNNPTDDETRYNLALCQKLKKDDDQNNQNNQNQNNQNNQDNKDNKDKDKDKQNNKNEENKDNKDNKQEPQDQNGMSKENLEQLLNAAIQDEKNTQQRMEKAMQQPSSRQLEKNW